MKLIFVRHGEPDYEKDSLTDKGWKEAELLAKRIHKLDVKEFYCSPLGRAKDTASLSLKLCNREAIICDWLREFLVPVTDPITGSPRIAWDFMPNYWTNESLLYDKDNWINAPIMRTGDISDNYALVKKGIDEILALYGYTRHGAFYRTEKGSEDSIVFFCHLGLEFAVLSYLLGIAAPVLWHGFYVAPSSVTVLTTEERVRGDAYFRCKCLGDTSHLYIADEPPSDSGFFCETYEP